MLVALGDLLDDIVVRPFDAIRPATDTPARISRRRGGSAANVAAAAVGLGAQARFIGQVGTDAVGVALVDELREAGVEVADVRRRGSTGSIVVIVDETGERTMLTDRRSCVGLDDPQAGWLDGATVVHIPLYSFGERPIADTAMATAREARDRGIPVSIDLSSTGLMEAMGHDAVERILGAVEPAVVFANADEARAHTIEGPVAGACTVVKRGPDPATVFTASGERIEVASPLLDRVIDTTGAGDAFAAGFLTAGMVGRGDWIDDPESACRAGHEAARSLLSSR